MKTSQDPKKWHSLINAGAAVVVITMFGISCWWPISRDAAHPENSISSSQFALSALEICMIVFLALVGKRITGRWAGFLINERNLMSLARFQTALWTVIVLSGYLVVAIARIIAKVDKPLDIAVDSSVWGLLGISLGTLVGTSLINSNKTDKKPASTEFTKTANALLASNNLPRAAATAQTQAAASLSVNDPKRLAAATSVVSVLDQNNQGTLYANPSLSDASFSDIFEGDEVGNAAYVDLAKAQMFLFTVLVAFSYFSELYSHTAVNLALDPKQVTSLPVLSTGMLALLGISHAGNLVGQTADKTKLQS